MSVYQSARFEKAAIPRLPYTYCDSITTYSIVTVVGCFQSVIPMGRRLRYDCNRYSSGGMPTLCLLNQASQSPVAKWAMCGTIMTFGIGTTTLFHLLFKPYVLKMR
uniref:AlNc14C301G10380 protein n=1 Tax=Albugo laibachii Nc14 TaxID=890382 RepID=F0WVP2_9STRA|nr:AlNc14C301G10380 [Albugo laibachii Nc14]|eukprot:CCA25487.1 AlNc14C301G10380 [Albugo laibachii Nc14]